MSRKIKLFILVSVLLNIILIGIIAGHSYHRYGMKHGERLAGEVAELLDRSSIAEEQREVLKQSFRNATSRPEKTEDMKRAQEEALTVLTAEKFDKAAFRKKIEKNHQNFGKRRQQITDAIVNIASNLNQDERKELAELLRKYRPGKIRK